MPGLTSEPAMQQQPGQRGFVLLRQLLPVGMGLLRSLGGIRLEISASFLSLGNRGPGRARHSFAVAVRSVTCQGRASGNTREERELVPAALISSALAECTKAVPPCGRKVVFLPESVWK